jgi:hypothetical protein
VWFGAVIVIDVIGTAAGLVFVVVTSCTKLDEPSVMLPNVKVPGDEEYGAATPLPVSATVFDPEPPRRRRSPRPPRVHRSDPHTRRSD